MVNAIQYAIGIFDKLLIGVSVNICFKPVLIGQGAKVTQAEKLREKPAKYYSQLRDDQRRSISNLIERLSGGK